MSCVLVHGLGQTAASWQAVKARLRPGRECLCLELPALMAGRPATYQGLYEAFAAACGRAEGGMDLCGLSLGAVLALHYAAEYPGRVRSLALIGAQYRMPGWLMRGQNMLFRLMPRAAFASMGFGKEDIIRLCGSMAALDLTPILGQVACPALVLCGEKDRANRRAAAELSALLPRARLQWVQGAGHEVNTAAPALLAEALEAFWTSLS